MALKALLLLLWTSRIFIGGMETSDKTADLYDYPGCDWFKSNNLYDVWKQPESKTDVNELKNPYGLTLLHCTAVEKDGWRCRLLLEVGSMVHMRDKRGRTPLHLAAERGSVDVAQMLVSRMDAKDLYLLDNSKMSSLQLALLNHNHKIVEIIVEKDSSGIRVEDWKASLHLAVVARNVKLTRMLLQRRKFPSVAREICLAVEKGYFDILELIVEFGYRLSYFMATRISLVKAVELNCPKLVETLLIEFQINPNQNASFDRTAVFVAASKGRGKILEMLVKHKARYEAKDPRDGRTLLHVAAYRGCVPEAKFLISKNIPVDVLDDAGNTPMFVAINNRHYEMVKTLLEVGARTDLLNGNSESLMHRVAVHGDVRFAKLLLDYGGKGVDIEARDNFSNTCLIVAVTLRRVDMVQFLLERGANPHVLHKSDRNLLHLMTFPVRPRSFIHGNETEKSMANERKAATPVIMRMLLDAKCDVEGREKKRRTPLHFAAIHGEVEQAQILLDAGAGKNAMDRKSRTPLITAAAANHLEMVHLLLKYGVDVEAKGKNGRTAFLEASRCSSPVVLEALRLAGADVHRMDNFLMSALHIAAQEGNIHVVDYILNLEQFDVHTALIDIFYRIPYYKSIVESHPEAMQLIINKHDQLYLPFMEFSDISERNPLVYYIKHNMEMAIFLMYGEEVDREDMLGNTAMHLAASIESSDFVQFLLCFGYNINAINKFEETPLDKAPFHNEAFHAFLRECGFVKMSEIP